MFSDKKKRDGKLRFVLPETIGRVTISDNVPEEIIMYALGKVTTREDTTQ
jgi:3-dehydroquinate synthetase